MLGIKEVLRAADVTQAHGLKMEPLAILALGMGPRHVIHFHQTYANMLWSWQGLKSLPHWFST